MTRSVSDYQVVVIAGGEGSRLKHRTNGVVPKYLLRIANPHTRVIDYVLRPAIKAGCEDFSFLISQRYEKITREYMERIYPYLDVFYSVESKKLGKGGAFRQALERKKIDTKKPSIVIFGDDIITRPDYVKEHVVVHEEKGKMITVAGASEMQLEFGMIEVDKNDSALVTKFTEKPTLMVRISVGPYVAEPEFYNIVLNKSQISDFESELFPDLAMKGQMATFTIPYEDWLPINDEKQILRAEKRLKQLKGF